MTIESDSQLLQPSALVELFELDCTDLGGDVLLFHGYQKTGKITWQGVEYTGWPIEATGFQITGEAQQPTPTLKVGNIDGTIGSLAIYMQDLVGAKLTRHRTLSKYLDAVNFPEGNATADPEQRYPDDVWYVNQKTGHDKTVLEFEMKSALDLSDVFLPRRLIISNVCPWKYRSAECGYTGAAMYDKDDNPTGNPENDKCGKRVSSCKVHFGEESDLNFGGFASASLT